MTATARDLTVQEQEQRAEVCAKLEARVKRAIRAGREALWEAAEALYEFDTESGWGPLGYEKLGDWLADPDVSMTSATYYRLVGVWRKLHVQRKLPADRLKELELSKVAIVLPSIEKGTVLTQDALDDAQALGARDLRTKYIKGKFDEATDSNPEPTPEPPVIDVTAEPVRADEVPVPEDEPEHGPLVSYDDEDEDDEELAEIEAAEAAVRAEHEAEYAHLAAKADPDPEMKTSLEAWLQLRDALIDAERSGQQNPRIPSVLIGPGLEGLDVVLENAAQGRGLFDSTER